MSEPTAVYLAPAQTFDYNELDAETRISLKARAERVGERTRRMASDIWENGREFHEAQQELANHKNGVFLAWVESTGYSKSTAYRMMEVYRQFKSSQFGKINIATSALYMLASPSTPDEARQEIIEAAEEGETVTYTKAKEVIEGHIQKRQVAQYEFTTAVRGWIERYGGNRENWLTVARNMWKNQHDAYLAEIKKNHLSQYDYTPDMLKTALSTIIADEELFQKRTLDQQVYAWLSAYNDRDGRTWRDLSDNQIHHANSPCYAAFVKEFPGLTDPKFYLKKAMYRLRRENPPKQVGNLMADRIKSEPVINQVMGDVKAYEEEETAVASWQEIRSPGYWWKCGRCFTDMPPNAGWTAWRNGSSPGDEHICEKCHKKGHAAPKPKLDGYSYTAELEQYIQAAETAVERENRLDREMHRRWQATEDVIKSQETAVATSPTKLLNPADLEQIIMRWGIGQRINDIPGQLELMQAIQQQKVNHPLWPEMVASIKGPYRAEDLATAVANWLQYLQERVRELETAEPTNYLSINTLESLTHAWLLRFFGEDVQNRLKAAHMMKSDGKCAFWQIMETHELKPTRQPYRTNHLRQAINNVTEQLRQLLHEKNQSAAALFLTEESAIWQLRHLLDDFDTRLVRFKMLYSDVEEITLCVDALRSAINLVSREAKRTLRSSDEEEE
ncbi:MAG: hypothetical protein H6658_01995 [Ardenticatenaceae bacterium]|nr:hypothetical protein [Ardenticatenaceae bacterium]